MKITRIYIHNLFGTLKHEIPLSDHGITFMHGPNGCGKTTVLDLVSAAVAGSYQKILEIDFESMEVEFEGKLLMKIQKVVWNGTQQALYDEDSEHDASHDLLISLQKSGQVLNSFSYRDHQRRVAESTPRVMPYVIERKIPSLRRVGAGLWKEVSSGRTISTADVLEKYQDVLGVEVVSRQPVWLKKVLDQCSIGYVKTQRLTRAAYMGKAARGDESEEPLEAITASSVRLKKRLDRQLADSAIQAQQLDRTFPARLLAPTEKSAKPISEPMLRERYRETERTSQGLMSAGLFEQAASVPLPETSLKPTEKRVLNLYLDDLTRKLATFEPLQRRIEAFLDIVGSKFKRKKLEIDRSEGFVITSMSPDSSPLPLTALSSGEQHQIILFYELLFSDRPCKVYLIDEPEISLHVEWQRAFLSDVEKIKDLTGAVFLIATHSPQVINSRRDLAVALDGGIDH